MGFLSWRFPIFLPTHSAQQVDTLPLNGDGQEMEACHPGGQQRDKAQSQKGEVQQSASKDIEDYTLFEKQTASSKPIYVDCFSISMTIYVFSKFYWNPFLVIPTPKHIMFGHGKQGTVYLYMRLGFTRPGPRLLAGCFG